MDKARNIAKVNTRLSIYALVMGIIFFSITFKQVYSALYEDTELSKLNLFGASNLDLGLNDNNNDIGNPYEFNFSVENTGEMSFLYGLRYLQSDLEESSKELCENIELSLSHDDSLIFQGKLIDLDIIFNKSEKSFMRLEKDNSDDYIMYFSYPSDASEVGTQTCIFSLGSFAWNQNTNPFEGYWDEELLTIAVSNDNLLTQQQDLLNSNIEKDITPEDNSETNL